MRKGLFTRFSAIFILLILISAPLFAVDLNTYIELAQSGNISEIESAFKEIPELKNQTFGDNKETFLIIALKNNRPLDIITLLIKYDCKVKAKTKDKRTTIMYAAKFNKDPDVLRLLIKECALTNSGRKKFINEKDETGLTAFDYAKQNPNSPSIITVLSEYEDTRQADKEEKARRKEEQKAAKEAEKAAKEEEKAKLKEEQKAAKEAEKAAKEEEKAKLKEEQKAAKEAEKAAKEEEKAKLKEEQKAAKEAEKAARKEEKAAKKEKARDQEEEPAVQQTEIKETPAPEPKKEPAVQKPAKDYTQDDFFANSYSENDFVDSQDEEESPQQNQQQKARSNRPVKVPPKEKTELQPLDENRLSKTDDIKTQPYTKSYLFDYINDITPESPEEDKENTASVRIENVDRQDRNGITLLMKAAKAGNDWDVQNLLANGANVQLRDKEGWSALMYAVRYQNNLSIVTKLIEAGAHVRVRNNYNSTPLLLAANYSQNPEILKLLLKDRTASEDEVYAAFILALTSEEGAEHVKLSKIKIFLEMGISVNRLWKGKTPLMYACQYGNSTQVIKLLMDSGARTSVQNQDGKTAFDFAGANSALPHDDIYWSINSIGR